MNTTSIKEVTSNNDDAVYDSRDDTPSRTGDEDRKSDNKEIIIYRDYSDFPEDDGTNYNSSLLLQHLQGAPPGACSTTKEPTFPVKLHMILSKPEFQDVIAWLPHGRSWRILNHKVFELEIIPLYFRHKQFSSFARQVNGWGFRRVGSGKDYNSYYHEMFLRGKPVLCSKMKRLTKKDMEARKKIEDGPLPDFYELSRQKPIPETTHKLLKSSAAVAGASPSIDVASHLLRRQQALTDPVKLNKLISSTSQYDPLAAVSSMDFSNNILGGQMEALFSLGVGGSSNSNTMNPAVAANALRQLQHQQQQLSGVPTLPRHYLDSLSILRQQAERNRQINAEVAAYLSLGAGKPLNTRISNNSNSSYLGTDQMMNQFR